jgi:hypothetical protein
MLINNRTECRQWITAGGVLVQASANLGQHASICGLVLPQLWEKMIPEMPYEGQDLIALQRVNF